MTSLVYLLEPSRLMLAWQRQIVGRERRARRVVGEIIRNPDGQAMFHYLNETEDFQTARNEGFQGYPGFRFRIDRPYHDINVLEAFLCRLPPRRRGDFPEYLIAHGLPKGFSGSDFSLLAHTGAKLPGDGFEVIPDLAGIEPPYDLIIEVAGTRHQEALSLESVAVGDQLSLVPEPGNTFDPHAIEAVHSTAGRLGYIPRPYCEAMQPLIKAGKLTAVVQKINGRPERRLVYLFIRVRPVQLPEARGNAE